MVIFFEALAGLGILWWLALFILPSANITLKVAQQRENIIYNFRYYPHADWEYLGAIKQLSIPYYTGAIEYRYSLAISTENIHHIINPSAWTVKIYNKTPNELNLLANTRFVTKDGLTFLTKEPITIPAGSEKTASELKVKLYAAEYDEHQQIIGTRGNIPNNTKLTIKNIKDSFYLNLIRAEAIENFTWGSSTSLGMISENDRELLAKKIKDAVYRDKLNIVSREFKEKNTMVLLADSLIKTRFNDISIEGKIGDRATTLKGNAQVSFDFFYLKRSDVVKAFSLYVHERQSDSIQLISIDPTSFALIMQDFKRAVQDKVFVVPTKVAILQGYDFTRDIKGILAMIKNAIVWKTIEESRKIILTYPEIASTKIDVWVFGGDSLPNIKSRLNLQVEF